MISISSKHSHVSLPSHSHEQAGNLSMLMLMLLGVVISIAHVQFKWPLNIPGHHGLEIMTLMLFGRMQSQRRWTGVIIASGAVGGYLTQLALSSWALAPKTLSVILLIGVCLDLLYRVLPQDWPLVLRGVLLGGLAFLVKPLLFLLLFLAIDMPMGLFTKHPLYYPLLTHVMFGATGAVCGMLLAEMHRHARNQKRTPHSGND